VAVNVDHKERFSFVVSRFAFVDFEEHRRTRKM